MEGDTDDREARNRVRRIRLRHGTWWKVSLIGAAGGLVLAAIGVRPTGSLPIDAPLLAVSCGFAAWCACSAIWWALVVAATIATGVNPLGIGTALGLVAMIGAAWVGLPGRSKPLERATIATVTMVSFGFIGNLWRFGFSAALGVGVVAMLAIAGLVRRPGSDRRIAARIVLAAGVAAIAFTGIAAVSAYQSRNSLRYANRHARAGLSMMRSADFAGAGTEFRAAGALFDKANRTLAAPWAQPARLVPIVAQQWRAMEQLTSAATTSSLVVGANAAAVDTDQLQLSDGVVNVDAIEALQAPLAEVQDAVGDLENAVTSSQSPWLAPQLSSRIDQLAADLHRQQQLGDNAVQALDVAPALLGADGERRYLVMFTTPAEARGQGGFVGSYAEITVDDGKIQVEKVDRAVALNVTIEQPLVLQDAPEDWMNTWGNYGFRKPPDGQVSDESWSIINMGAHFPNNAQVVAELYPNSGGDELDGIFSIDVYALEALVGLVGPIETADGTVLTGSNTADYLVYGQYLSLSDEDIATTNTARHDALGEIADEVSTRLLQTDPPDPLELGQALAPFAQEHRILGWAANPDEQAMFETIDIDGRVLDEGDITVDGEARSAIKVVTNNAGANKIDSFLQMDTEVDGDQVTIEFTNTAPRSGLPRYVIGSVYDDIPWGTNIALVSVYATEPISDVAVDGSPVQPTEQREADRYLYTWRVEIAAGDTATITFTAAAPDPILVNDPPPGRRPAAN